jgi:hypothetical protein
VKDVSHIFYEGARHEPLNKFCRDQMHPETCWRGSTHILSDGVFCSYTPASTRQKRAFACFGSHVLTIWQYSATGATARDEVEIELVLEGANCRTGFRYGVKPDDVVRLRAHSAFSG